MQRVILYLDYRATTGPNEFTPLYIIRQFIHNYVYLWPVRKDAKRFPQRFYNQTVTIIICFHPTRLSSFGNIRTRKYPHTTEVRWSVRYFGTAAPISLPTLTTGSRALKCNFTEKVLLRKTLKKTHLSIHL